jgi:hypothetical protein
LLRVELCLLLPNSCHKVLIYNVTFGVRVFAKLRLLEWAPNPHDGFLNQRSDLDTNLAHREQL